MLNHLLISLTYYKNLGNEALSFTNGKFRLDFIVVKNWLGDLYLNCTPNAYLKAYIYEG